MGGALAIDSDGFVAGTIAYDSSTEERMEGFKMDASREVVVGTVICDAATATQDCSDPSTRLAPNLTVWVPEPAFGGALSVGALCLLLGASGRRAIDLRAGANRVARRS